MMLLAACCCAGMIPLSFAFVCSCSALCSCIRTDREKSEIVRYNAPATTCAFFVLDLLYCVLLTTALLCDSAHLHGLNDWCPCVQRRRREIARRCSNHPLLGTCGCETLVYVRALVSCVDWGEVEYDA